MPAISLIRDATAAPAEPDPVYAATPKMAFSANQFIVIVPYAPNSSSVSNMAGKWVTLERPGATPLLEWAGEQLPVLDVELAVGFPDHRDIEDILKRLRMLAGDPNAVVVTGWHGLAEGTWRITDLSVSTTRLGRSNRVAQATVSIQLTRASDVVVGVGPLTGGAPLTTGNLPAAAITTGRGGLGSPGTSRGTTTRPAPTNGRGGLGSTGTTYPPRDPYLDPYGEGDVDSRKVPPPESGFWID